MNSHCNTNASSCHYPYCGIIYLQQNGLQGRSAISREGGDAVEVYQTLTLMISFATLVVLILSFHKRK
ncbi:hypothetical protein COLU111180_17870 [Cohnella lubricantis]|uniref:putative holin-like toxin n=1 Tax=Cohnella lubricantis TaxID=2163172 RepID=UPI001C898A09|nr:hypothetical protein [Cohnella lubricantis]